MRFVARGPVTLKAMWHKGIILIRKFVKKKKNLERMKLAEHLSVSRQEREIILIILTRGICLPGLS